MAAVLREAFDPIAQRARQAADEASLLAIVKTGVKNPAAAKQAAAELMRSYVSIAGIADDETRRIIEDGKRIKADADALADARAGLETGSRVARTEPIDYFASEVTIKDAGGRRPRGFKDNRLELRAAYGDWLSLNEAMYALTTREGKKKRTRTTIPSDQRAKNMSAVESHLESYVLSIYSGYSRNECAQFVRESFPHWPWNDGGRAFAYV